MLAIESKQNFADGIRFVRQMITKVGPEMMDIETLTARLMVDDSEVDLPALPAFGSDDRRDFTSELARARTPESFQAAAAQYLDKVLADREQILVDLRKRLAGIAKLNIWDFVYCSVATFATLGTGDIVPASTFTRMLVVGFGVDLFFRSIQEAKKR